MTKYREIIRLAALVFSMRNIALSCSVSRNTVSKVLAAAKEKSVAWPLDDSQTDKVLKTLLFPKNNSKEGTDRPFSDYEYIQKELLRNGVSKSFFGPSTAVCQGSCQ